MIVSRMIGGLGNQMFQYAMGRALSLRRSEPLHLDISPFLEYQIHQGFELDRVFACSPLLVDQGEVRRLLGWRSQKWFRRVLMRPGFTPFHGEHLAVEPHFHYWPGINELPADVYLVGYWQSEKYFSDAVGEIRADFTFRSPLSGRNAELAERIERKKALSLHVRRGDYALQPKTMAVHGLCPLDYYRAAIHYVAQRVDNLECFVFSDDIDWVKSNLDPGLPCYYVDHNRGAAGHQDMRLMSLCRHHIIANSSFSWWGAWLNPRPDKIVVAPRQWFVRRCNVEDLFPAGWIRI